MTLDELLILTDDEIDYAALDTELVQQAARQAVDPFIATSALAELYVRDRRMVRHVCVDILHRTAEDRHLRAFALTTLYSVAPDAGIVEMERLAHDADEKLLGAMVENVMSDVERFRASNQALVSDLLAKVRQIEMERFSDVEEVRNFLALFDSTGAVSG